jgi:hypothetical protein
MKHFKKIDLPNYDTLLIELNNLLNSNTLTWGNYDQICLNSLPGDENNFHRGAGSLTLNWNNVNTISVNGINNIEVEPNSTQLLETEFIVLCNQFKGTVFENLYNMLDQRYILGRVRLMKLEPKTCLSWHTDDSPRLHYPILTQEGCLLVIEDEVMHIPLENWYMVDTTKKHTAFNSSKMSRIHLVAVILGTK